MPPPKTAASREYRHSSVLGFYVRVSRPDAKGNVRRSYIARYDDLDSSGKKVDKKKVLGVTPLMRYGEALDLCTSALQRARKARREGRPSIPTLKEAFDAYMHFKTEEVLEEERLAPATVKDYTDRFTDLIPLEWHNKPLDQLTHAVWQDWRKTCTTAKSFEVRFRKPVSPSRFDVMLCGPISGLYRRTIVEHPLLKNPVTYLRETKVVRGSTKKSNTFIPSHDLRRAVNYIEQEFRAPQRDITLIGLLTGWRLSLMTAIPLDRIKQEKRAVLWKRTDPGGPYADEDGDEFEYPVSDILWERVFAPRLETVRAGQKYLIESGRVPGEPFSDCRDSLSKLDKVLGVHVSAHVLRKTFMSLAPNAGIQQRVISHLAMHKTSGGASDVTLRYQKRDFRTMQEGANLYAQWFAKEVGWDAPSAAAAAVVEGINNTTLQKLQALANMDQAQLDKLLQLAALMK